MTTATKASRKASGRRKSRKQDLVDKAIAFINKKYRPNLSPRVILWPELMDEMGREMTNRVLKKEWDTVGLAVFEHFRARFTVVKVTLKIRRLAKHGTSPKRDSKRTDAAYEGCLPVTNEPAFGFVIFPPNGGNDHPLYMAWYERQGGTAASFLRNIHGEVNRGVELGNVSNEGRDDTFRPIIQTVQAAIGQWAEQPAITTTESPSQTATENGWSLIV